MNIQKLLKQVKKQTINQFIEASDSFSEIKVGDTVFSFTQSPKVHSRFETYEKHGRWVESVISEVIETFDDGGGVYKVLPKLKNGGMGSARVKFWRPGYAENTIKVIK